jgi:hypothetical protein
MTHIYLIGVSETHGPVKIGRSSNPSRRLKDLRQATHEPLKLLFTVEVLGEASQAEARIKQFLAEFLLDHEWYRFSPAKARRVIQEFVSNTPALPFELRRLLKQQKVEWLPAEKLHVNLTERCLLSSSVEVNASIGSNSLGRERHHLAAAVRWMAFAVLHHYRLRLRKPDSLDLWDCLQDILSVMMAKDNSLFEQQVKVLNTLRQHFMREFRGEFTILPDDGFRSDDRYEAVQKLQESCNRLCPGWEQRLLDHMDRVLRPAGAP